MNSRFIHPVDDGSEARRVREVQDREHAELRDAVQAGSAEYRHAQAARNHAGVGRVRRQPGRARRA